MLLAPLDFLHQAGVVHTGKFARQSHGNDADNPTEKTYRLRLWCGSPGRTRAVSQRRRHAHCLPCPRGRTWDGLGLEDRYVVPWAVGMLFVILASFRVVHS